MDQLLLAAGVDHLRKDNLRTHGSPGASGIWIRINLVKLKFIVSDRKGRAVSVAEGFSNMGSMSENYDDIYTHIMIRHQTRFRLVSNYLEKK